MIYTKFENQIEKLEWAVKEMQLQEYEQNGILPRLISIKHAGKEIFEQLLDAEEMLKDEKAKVAALQEVVHKLMDTVVGAVGVLNDFGITAPQKVNKLRDTLGGK